MHTQQQTDKRVAVVSGGTGYVGACIAKKLAEDGMTVAIMYNTTKDQKVQEVLTSLGQGNHKAYKCNLKNKEEIVHTINTIEKELGTLYACVHSAGQKPKRKQLMQSHVEDLEEQLEGTVMTSFNFLTTCALRLKEHKQGVLIGITTIGVVVPEETKSLGTYIPAKYAVQGILTTLKEEMNVYGVSVFSVAPSFMEGGMNSDIPKAFVEILKVKNKKLITGKDVAMTISSLCTLPFSPKNNLTVLVA